MQRLNLLIFLFVLQTSFVSAQDETPSNEKVSIEELQLKRERELKLSREYQKYKTESSIGEDLYKGQTLTYVCSRKHYACVSDSTLRFCELNPEMGCMIIKRYKGQKECFESQLQMMLKSKIKSFCNSN